MLTAKMSEIVGKRDFILGKCRRFDPAQRTKIDRMVLDGIASGKSMQDITANFNRLGLKNAQGKEFKEKDVVNIRSRLRRNARKPQRQRTMQVKAIVQSVPRTVVTESDELNALINLLTGMNKLPAKLKLELVATLVKYMGATK